MKKLILLGTFILGTVAFSAGGLGNRQINGMTSMDANNGICVVTGTTQRGLQGAYQGNGINFKNNTMGRRGNNNNLRYSYLSNEQKLIFEKNIISIQEKNLEIKKAMLEATPNWQKIEKLNEEIAVIQSKNRTETEKAYVNSINSLTSKAN